MRESTFFKSLYDKIKIINSSFNSSSCNESRNELTCRGENGCALVLVSFMWLCVSACTREKDRETYVHVEDGWFVLVRKQLSFEICTINLPSHQSANLDTIHSVHSCSFEDRIVRFSRCVQNSIRKYFSPAHLKPTNFKKTEILRSGKQSPHAKAIFH